jgi:hypothetical protein
LVLATNEHKIDVDGVHATAEQADTTLADTSVFAKVMLPFLIDKK